MGFSFFYSTITFTAFAFLTINAIYPTSSAVISEDSCKYIDWETGYKYDLTPLAMSDKNYYATEEDNDSYILNLCGPVVNDECKNASALSCQVTKDTGALKTLGIDYKNSGITIASRTSSKQIELIMVNGDGCSGGVYRNASIIFECAAVDNTSPEFLSESTHCFYEFKWKSRYACPVVPAPSSDEKIATTASNDGQNYDVQSLRKLIGNWVYSTNDKDYIINIAQSINSVSAHPAAATICTGSGGCLLQYEYDNIRGRKGFTVTSMGAASTAAYYFDSKNVLHLKYSEGTGSSDSDPKCSSNVYSMDVSLLCDANVGNLIFIKQEECTYFLELKSPYGCALENPGSSIGGFALFVLIVFLLTFSYCLGGCLYKRNVHNAKGWNQMPHHDLLAGCFDRCTSCVSSSRRSQMERTRI